MYILTAHVNLSKRHYPNWGPATCESGKAGKK